MHQPQHYCGSENYRTTLVDGQKLCVFENKVMIRLYRRRVISKLQLNQVLYINYLVIDRSSISYKDVALNSRDIIYLLGVSST